MRLILELADRANPYVESREPWKLNKDPSQAGRLQDVCTVALNLFRQLSIYLSPVLPKLAEQTGQLLGESISHWGQSKTPLTGTPVAKFRHMLRRVEAKDVQAMVEESKEEDAVDSQSRLSQVEDSDAPLKAETLTDEITFDQFTAVDLRVARVIAAEDVPEARKLLRITLSLGGQQQRTVLAGIKEAYQPEQLVGRLVVMAANLAPRTMKFGVSEGMILASGLGGKDVFLLGVDEGAEPGQRVH